MNSVLRCLVVLWLGLLAAPLPGTLDEPPPSHQDDENRVDKSNENEQVPVQSVDDKRLSDMEMMERVAGLLLELESSQITERDSAEKELEQLGPRILDYLEPADDATTDSLERLQRVRLKLEKAAAEAATQPSIVTLSGLMSIETALQTIEKQTGNKVRLRGGDQDPLRDRELKFSLDQVSFWTALKTLCQKSDLQIDSYGSAPGVLVLTPIQLPLDQQGNPTNIQADPLPSDQQSIFDIEVIRVDASRNLAQPSLNHCRLHLRIRWEPRVQPISIDIPMSELKIVDEFDKVIQLANPEGTLSGIVQPEIPELEFSIPLPLIDRQIESIKSLKAKINTVLPGRIETFKFKDVSQLKDGTQQQKAGAVVTYDGTLKNDDIYGVTIRLAFEETSRAFESHQGWVFDNQAYLIDKEGNQFDNIGMETVSQSETEVGIQFFFAENPLEYTIVYKTPAAIIQLPVSIELKKIPLP